MHHAGAKILDHHLRGGNEPLKDLLAGRCFQVKCDGALTCVLRQEGCAHPLLVEQRVRTQFAGEIARARHFHLDDVSAKGGQLVAAERPRQHIGQVQHADAFQQSHRPLPVSPPLRSGHQKFFLELTACYALRQTRHLLWTDCLGHCRARNLERMRNGGRRSRRSGAAARRRRQAWLRAPALRGDIPGNVTSFGPVAYVLAFPSKRARRCRPS